VVGSREWAVITTQKFLELFTFTVCVCRTEIKGYLLTYLLEMANFGANSVVF